MILILLNLALDCFSRTFTDCMWRTHDHIEHSEDLAAARQLYSAYFIIRKWLADGGSCVWYQRIDGYMAVVLCVHMIQRLIGDGYYASKQMDDMRHEIMIALISLLHFFIAVWSGSFLSGPGLEKLLDGNVYISFQCLLSYTASNLKRSN